MSTFRSVLRDLLILLACMLGSTGCTHMFYYPTNIMYVRNPKLLDGVKEDVSFTASDGVKLAGWFFKARHGGHKGAVVQFHGNAQNMTAHFNSLFWMIDEGYDLLAFDYRGYGISEGKPSPAGLNKDALAAIHYILKREKAPKDGSRDIVLYGQSLGGAVLLRAYDDVTPQERKRVKALVIESSFYNYHEIARDVLSRNFITFLLQPLAYVLVSDAYGPEDSIPRVSPTPLLVMHGDQDRVIPPSFGKKIYELARQPKKFLLVPEAGHIACMSVDHGKYREKLLEFLAAQR